MRTFCRNALAIAICILAMSVARAQDYPTRPIRIVTGTVGSGVDVIARVIAQGISGPLGQSVIVDNRSAGVIPGEIVSRAQPDGYTLLVFGGTIWIGPFFEKFPFDPLRDLAPVSLTNEQTNILVVHPSATVKSVKELIALAKATPGVLNCSMGAKGGAAHLAAELFKSMADVNIVNVPFKGAGPAVTAVVSGEVQLMFSTAGAVEPHIKFGRLRALAVTSARPSALVPGLPTVGATVPGYASVGNHAMFAPPKTPAPIIQRLNSEVVRALQQPDTRQKLNNIGVEPIGTSPKELADYMRAEMARLGKMLKEVGVRGE